jgi:hypothetical protein
MLRISGSAQLVLRQPTTPATLPPRTQHLNRLKVPQQLYVGGDCHGNLNRTAGHRQAFCQAYQRHSAPSSQLQQHTSTSTSLVQAGVTALSVLEVAGLIVSVIACTEVLAALAGISQLQSQSSTQATTSSPQPSPTSTASTSATSSSSSQMPGSWFQRGAKQRGVSVAHESAGMPTSCWAPPAATMWHLQQCILTLTVGIFISVVSRALSSLIG